METTPTLPSRGLVYKTPASQIKIRTMKGRDEKLLAEITGDNIEGKFCSVFQRLVSGIAVEDLTVGDEVFLMLWLSINTYGPIRTAQWACGDCGDACDVSIDLSKIDVESLPGDFSEPMIVPVGDGKTVGLRLPRVRDRVDLERLSVEARNSGKSLDLYLPMAMCITGSDSIENKVAMLDDMEAADVAKLRVELERFYHGPRLEWKWKCPSCQAVNSTPLAMTPAIFFTGSDSIVGHS